MRFVAIAAALAATTLACRTAPKNRAAREIQTVADADLGRLAPEQMGPIQASRAALDEARDAVARAQHRLRDSRHEEEWANADKAAAEGDRLHAAAELSSAKDAGDQRMMGLASEHAATAALRAQAADARIEYARKLFQARDAELKTAEARVRRAEWEIERAKLMALREAKVPAASKYDAAPIERRVAEAVKAEDGARARAKDLATTSRTAYDQWRSLTDRYEARARSIPTG